MSDEEYNEDELVEEDEGTKEDAAEFKPITMTGSVASGGAYASSGGMITTTTSSPVWSTYPTTWATGGTIKAASPIPAKAKKTVAAPPRMTDKVLVAFMDSDEEDESKDIIWAAHLKPIDMQLTFSEDGSRMTIEFSLEDHHGNLEK